jgi:biopolymer transport protein ExbD
MSHGGTSEAEADLTPLLDLVLQLLMFFIVNVQFVSEQVSSEIKLPRSESARPVDKADPAALFLNQKVVNREFLQRLTDKERELVKDADVAVLIPSKPPMTMPQARSWLRDRYDQLRRLSKDGEVPTTVHFRPDENLEYRHLLLLMDYAKQAGFRKFKVRATIRKKS